MILNTYASEIGKKFDEKYPDFLVDVIHTYNYTEGHEEPLKEAKEYVNDIKNDHLTTINELLEGLKGEYKGMGRLLEGIAPEHEHDVQNVVFNKAMFLAIARIEELQDIITKQMK